MNTSVASFLENRTFCGAVILTLSLFGVGANIIIVVSRKIPKKGQMGSLILSSTICLFPYIIVYPTCAMTNCEFFDDNWINALSTPDTIGYYAYQLTLVLLLIDRFLGLFWKAAAKIMQKYELFFTFTSYLLVCVLTAVEWIFTCRKMFNIEHLHFFFEYEAPGQVFMNIHYLIGLCSPIIMIILCVTIFLRIRFLHKRLAPFHHAAETSLMIQYFLICCFSWFGSFCFFFIVPLRKSLGINLTLLPTVSSVLAISSHSYIFMLYKSGAWHKFTTALFHPKSCFKKRRAGIVNTTTYHSNIQ